MESVMPFNIELPTGKDAIKIQIVKNVITIYFYGKNAEQERKNWSHLNGHFLATLKEFNPKEILIPASLYHRKKEHTNILERSTIHLHIHFLKEVTPQLFVRYLKGFYQYQLSHEKKYAFFQSPSAVVDVVNSFAYYYKVYKGSPLETIYEEETILSLKEQQEYAEEVRKIIVEEQLQYSSLLTYFSHPVFNSPATISSITNSKMEEDVNVNPRTISI